MKKLVQLVLLLLLTVPAWGNNVWYISPTGSDSNPGTSSGAAFATFAHALAAMSGCDTLIVENGYYYDVMNMNTSNLAGNVSGSGCYTTVEAVTPFAVTIDAGQMTTSANATVFISEPYINVIGIKVAGNMKEVSTTAGSVNGTTLTIGGTITGVFGGVFTVGQQMFWVNNGGGPRITSQLSGTAGGAGTYQLSSSSAVYTSMYTTSNDATCTMCSVTGSILTVSSSGNNTITGTFTVGDTLYWANQATYPTIVSQLSGTTGQAGTYQLSTSGVVVVPMTAANVITPWGIYSTNHVKIQQTAGYNTICAIYNGYYGDNWNTNVYSIGPSSSYILVEDSHAWGCGRYKFEVYESDHVILRRDVARHDFAGDAWENHSTYLSPFQQCGEFVNYDGSNDLFQNDIAIDSGTVDGDTGNIYGGLWSEHNNGSIDTPIIFEGSVVDNLYGNAAWQDDKQSGVHTFVNDAAVNVSGGMMLGAELQSSGSEGVSVSSVVIGTSSTTVNLSASTYIYAGNTIVFSGLTSGASILNNNNYQLLTGATYGGSKVSSFTINYASSTTGTYTQSGASFVVSSGVTLPTTSFQHVTVANVNGTGNSFSDVCGSNAVGIGVEGVTPFNWYTSLAVENNIFQNISSSGINNAAMADLVTSNYDYFYQNTNNFLSTCYEGYTPVAGAQDAVNVNPQIKYVTREEPGTPVYGTASDGGNIGATILYEIGTTGTLWGDAGYDTVTGTSLWPFPNESTIKSDMASFTMTNPITGATISGTRGFAATATSLCGAPLSLTTYIWEALGYPTPSGVESGCSGYALSGIASPSSGGTVVPTSGSTCAQNYSSSGIAYSCTATPATGYTFASWSSCPGTATGNVCSGTMPSSSAVAQANFSSGATYTLTPATAGTGSGTMICSHSGSGIVSGTPYTCTATAASGSTLTSLVDGCGGTVSGNTTSGTVTGNCTITATFTAATTYMLSTSTAGTGSCTVAATSGSVCAGSYTSGTPYSCQAMAASGSSFASWSSTCGGTSAGTTYSGSMPSASCNVQATCTLIPGGPGSQWQGLGVQGQAGIW